MPTNRTNASVRLLGDLAAQLTDEAAKAPVFKPTPATLKGVTKTVKDQISAAAVDINADRAGRRRILETVAASIDGAQAELAADLALLAELAGVRLI